MISAFKQPRAMVAASALAAGLLMPQVALAQIANPDPEDLLSPRPDVTSAPVVQPIPVTPVADIDPVVPWSLSDARMLLKTVEGIGKDGLMPADYQPDALRDAIADGAGPILDEVASRSMRWLIEDMRDGRTPMEDRRQWFVVDPDADLLPTTDYLTRATQTHDIAGTLADLAPTHPDYAVLRDELGATPKANAKKRAKIMANMDRWRWLARDLGKQYLITNVPEYQLRLTVNDKIIRTYKTIVGKPGRTATPQLAETVEGVIFNPTWTVPQSIVKGEGLGAKVIGNPAWAKRAGYKGTKGENGYISVVQQPGPGNSLGLMKLDMPNEHAIFLHDTPARGLFDQADRALSHGCIRTERARELAITLAILGNNANTPEARQEAASEAVAISTSGTYTRVPIETNMPVYITYFTMARDIDGKLASFKDIYDRDAPVLASLAQPREANRARKTSEEVIEILDDLQTS